MLRRRRRRECGPDNRPAWWHFAQVIRVVYNLVMPKIGPEIEQILRDLNPWWEPPHRVRPAPPEFRRRRVASIISTLRGPKSLIHVLRGPRQVGKTTALH